jgi:hypothetical protein
VGVCEYPTLNLKNYHLVNPKTKGLWPATHASKAYYLLFGQQLSHAPKVVNEFVGVTSKVNKLLWQTPVLFEQAADKVNASTSICCECVASALLLLGLCIKYVACAKPHTHLHFLIDARKSDGTKQTKGTMPLRSTTAKWLGSCSVIASALPVLTESVLDAETCAHMKEFVFAEPGERVDLMTRAAVLQESLASLLKLDWHGKVRAFAGSAKQLELTPRPGEWETYFESFDVKNKDDEKADTKRYDDSYLTSAWDFLTKNADALVIVTQYSAETSAAGQIRAHKSNCYNIWQSLPEKLKRTEQVAVAYAKATTNFALFRFSDFPEVHYICIKNDNSYSFECVPETLKQNKEFCAKASELAYYKWYCQMPNVPPRVLHNPFSDCLYEQLSPGEYTRQDVLERVKICGDVLLLHDPVHHADMEIVAAALATSRGLDVCYLLSLELTDDFEFMTDAIQKNPWCVLVSSTRLQENADFCKMALAKTYRSVHVDTWGWVPKSIVYSSPDVAAYFLVSQIAVRIDVAQVNKELIIDLAGRDTSVLSHLHELRYAGIETAHNLLQDDEFLLACVKQNWRHAPCAYVANKTLKAEILDLVRNHFGDRKWGLRRALSEFPALND